MAAVAMGATVSFPLVDDFDLLSEVGAHSILYDLLIPACEAKGVKLSAYGNHAGYGSLSSVEKYNQEKDAHALFDVERVQQAYALIPKIVQKTSQFKSKSYGLKHTFKEHPQTSYGYLSNGDLIAAMLIRGYKARFGRRGKPMDVNCEFKVKVKV